MSQSVVNLVIYRSYIYHHSSLSNYLAMKREDGNPVVPPAASPLSASEESISQPTKREKGRVSRTGRWTPEEHLLFVNGIFDEGI